MHTLPKLTALGAALGAATIDAAYLVLATVENTTPSIPLAIAAGILGGIGGAAVVVGVYKQKVDALEEKAHRLEQEKADRDAIERVEKMLDKIDGHVTWLYRNHSGEK